VKEKNIFLIFFELLIGYIGYKLFLPNGFEHISTDQLADMLNNPDHKEAYYVDVREPHEFNAGHIREMNNVPLSQLENNYELIPKDKTIVIICQSGKRSLQAAKTLKDLGYQDIINVKGGMLDWEGAVTK